jgi:O-antigen ligase
VPITNISNTDPTITYVPHNDVLYTLMRMGLPGAVAMWMLMAAGIIAGCRLAKSVDREVGVVGVVTAAAVVAYALEGATDKGFFWYRIAFVMGTLLGLTEAGRRLQRAVGSRRRNAGTSAGAYAHG